MDITSVSNRRWTYIYSRAMTYQKVRLYYHGFALGILGCKMNYELYRFKDGVTFIYHDATEEEYFKAGLVNAFIDRPFVISKVSRLEKHINKQFSDYLKFLATIPGDPSGLSNSKLCRILEEYYQWENALSEPFWILFTTVENALTTVVTKLLKKSEKTEAEIQHILATISLPTRPTPLDCERLSLLAVALRTGAGRNDALQKHIAAFTYLPMYDVCDHPHTATHFKRQLHALPKSQKAVIHERERIQEKYHQRQIKVEKILWEVRDDTHLLYLLQFFVAYAYLKDYKPMVRDKSSFYVRPIFAEVARRLRLSLRETLFLSEKEIPPLLEGSITISRREIRRRANNSVYLCSGRSIVVVTDKKTLNDVDFILAGEKKVTELTGMAVSGGKICGRVKLIISNHDFGKFRTGDILVASATRPDFVPLMKSAAAIVTDEGGLLSHAAIVSRELGKPCVVGTKHATQVLRDGDEVEVDAEKGTVTKIM